MNVSVEIGEDGLLKVNDPNWLGKKIMLSIPSHKDIKPAGLTNWDEIWNIVQEAQQLDIPRRSPEEIERDLHKFRASGI